MKNVNCGKMTGRSRTEVRKGQSLYCEFHLVIYRFWGRKEIIAPSKDREVEIFFAHIAFEENAPVQIRIHHELAVPHDRELKGKRGGIQDAHVHRVSQGFLKPNLQLELKFQRLLNRASHQDPDIQIRKILTPCKRSEQLHHHRIRTSVVDSRVQGHCEFFALSLIQLVLDGMRAYHGYVRMQNRVAFF